MELFYANSARFILIVIFEIYSNWQKNDAPANTFGELMLNI